MFLFVHLAVFAAYGQFFLLICNFFFSFLLYRDSQCACKRVDGPPLAGVCELSSHDMSWPVYLALATDGHVLPQPLTRNAVGAPCPHYSPLGPVRWMLQQGAMKIDRELLLNAARCGREDILQLAQRMHEHIAPDVIEWAAKFSAWETLVWACRSGVPFDYARMQQVASTRNTHTHTRTH